ncbi:hypothetical protein EON67_12055 [archaeon]|nr:MAG: hypothetical protein EON67_12055 [archaeon]
MFAPSARVRSLQTHPSQSCFMSSMDQHTHSGYQAMLAEAVAVVVAPRDADTPSAVFRLTDETDGGTGLQLILDCSVRAVCTRTRSAWVCARLRVCFPAASARVAAVRFPPPHV